MAIIRGDKGHGYARLTSAGCEIMMTPDQGGVVFFDLAFEAGGWDVAVGAMRSIPPSLIGEASKIIIRSPIVKWMGQTANSQPADFPVILSPGSDWPSHPDDFADSVSRALQDHHLPSRAVGVFELPAGAPPQGSANVSLEDLALFRSTELETYLRVNGAIWEPERYHYQLPSGHHSSSFVRVADALNDPYAPAALARWLYGSLTEGTAVVVDSGTLMPLIRQIDYVARIAGAKLPLPASGVIAIEALDRYPVSRFEYLRRFKSLHATDVLAVLSVSSTGRTYRMLEESLKDTVGDNWRAECLVARDRPQAKIFPDPTASGLQAPWLSIDGLYPPSDPAKSCELCRDNQKSPVIRIHPRSFAAMVLPDPKAVMPDTAAARRNASLFRWYQDIHSASGRHSVQLAGTERSRFRAIPYHRPEQPQRVRFEPLNLLIDEDLMIERVQKRRLELLNLPQHDLSRDRIVAALDKLEKGNPTIAVCDKEELDILTRLLGDSDKAKGRFYELGRQICPELKDITSDREDDVREKLAHHRSVLLVAAGLQTGVTLQHLVVSVQNVFRDLGADPAMHGLVLHAHPNDSAAWTSVRNSFGGRRNPALLALWLTYLPSVSPFAEEFELLRVGQNEWFEGFPKAREVWEQRIAWLNTSGGGAARDPVPVSPLFAATEVTLRRTSIYGSLNDRHLLPAMGAALTEALERQKTDGSPEWVQIDLLNALRSYFDGLLHAALIRWVSPQRAWWGTANDCVALIDELRGRFFNDDWPLLLCELLLAAAQGKVPDAGVELLLGYAEEDEARLTDEARGYLELAVLLVKNLWRPAAA